MTAYVDSSVVLRIVLGEPGRLREWRRITRPLASEVVRLECLRTIDRARLRLGLADEAVADRRAAVQELLEGFDLVRVDEAVLERAADPFPTSLGSLDGIHLATALLARAGCRDLVVATHDRELATAARAVGFRVLGSPGRQVARRDRALLPSKGAR
ncbi:MAG: type II toxin-antitoxin system VapC family toxin [Alphaproteobacteria bacterium]